MILIMDVCAGRWTSRGDEWSLVLGQHKPRFGRFPFAGPFLICCLGAILARGHETLLAPETLCAKLIVDGKTGKATSKTTHI